AKVFSVFLFEGGVADAVREVQRFLRQPRECRQGTELDLVPQDAHGIAQRRTRNGRQSGELRGQFPDDVLLGHRKLRDRGYSELTSLLSSRQRLWVRDDRQR